MAAMGRPGKSSGRPMRAATLSLILAGSALGALPAAVSAQVIDPKILQSLQGQLGSGQRQASPQPSESSAQPSGEMMSPTGKIDTTEEQEVRRAQARRQLQRLYDPSTIEEDYRARLGDRSLRQFGYDVFQSGSAPTGVRAGAIGDDYVLGIGDEIEVSFRGATNASETVRVDRDGRIVVGALRPVQAAGRSLGSVRAELASLTRSTLLATDVYVSVGEVRAISVFVGGEVERPGQVSLTSLSDIASAIARAGGVRRSGSLRQVRIVRAGGGSISVDLYGLLGIGAPSNVRLRDGDRIIVPVIGPTVAVAGAVARPGIYELRGTASVAEVVAFAGGAVRQRGAQIVISRIAADGTETFVRAPSAGSSVLGGDAIQLVGGSPGGTVGRVQLSGNVSNPGPRPLMSAETIADLVGRPEDLRADTYQLVAGLVRRDAGTGARVIELVNLARELRERPSTRLQGDDRLYILSRRDIEFLNGVAVRSIVLGQPNPLPQCRSLDNLEALVRDTQATRFHPVTRGGFVVGGPSNLRAGSVAGTLAAGGSSEEAGGADVARLADEDICSPTFEQEPDLLPILIENSISVGGSIRRPGAYPVAGPVSARDLSILADGVLTGASNMELDITRASSGLAERTQLDPAGNLLRTTLVGPGDDLRFNAEMPRYESSGVLLSGEVNRPGLYTVRKGERLSELIARAGGLSEQAYAYGAVFTRRSVKQAQEEGFRRTARELNNSLIAVAARSTEKSSDGLIGAASIIQSLAQTEAPGRMVVEADPRVLERRPDLDTVLEAGDSIFIPKTPNYVLVLGDVNNPGAHQFVAGKAATNYLTDAGGALATADRRRTFVVLPNGQAQPLRVSGWSGIDGAPPPGSTIIVPKNIDPLYRLSIFRDVTTIIAQLATSVATVAVLATR